MTPPGFEWNDGISHVAANEHDDTLGLDVPIRMLDELVGARSISVLKIDAEGYGRHALRRAERALREHRIRHIVFEDHEVRDSAVVAFLQSFGYRTYALTWVLRDQW
jgi:hypothetical protein